MASREFLKILSSARLGDVSAQQKLAEAYLTGAFKTPIQPANALIWLEKSYLLIQNQSSEGVHSNNPGTLGISEQLANIPLSQTFRLTASFSRFRVLGHCLLPSRWLTRWLSMAFAQVLPFRRFSYAWFWLWAIVYCPNSPFFFSASLWF